MWVGVGGGGWEGRVFKREGQIKKSKIKQDKIKLKEGKSEVGTSSRVP